MAKKKKSKKKPAARRSSPSVAAAHTGMRKLGSYAEKIQNKAMIEALGRMTLGMYAGKSPEAALTPAERAVQKRVLGTLGIGAARAARLPRTSTKAPAKKPAAKKPAPKRTATVAAVKAAAAKKAPPAKKGARMVTAEQVVKDAATSQLKRWLCEGRVRSGCGRGGTRVITGQGKFYRLRGPSRFMSGG